MDGKGRWRDNVFVERVWRSIKYEEVYLHAYASVNEARQSIGRYIDFYNTTRPHSSLKAQTPDQVYFNRLPVPLAGKKRNFHLRKKQNTVRTTGTTSVVQVQIWRMDTWCQESWICPRNARWPITLNPEIRIS